MFFSGACIYSHKKNKNRPYTSPCKPLSSLPELYASPSIFSLAYHLTTFTYNDMD